MLPIITAFAAGEAVETLNWKGEWIVATDLTFEAKIDKYRISLAPLMPVPCREQLGTAAIFPTP